MSGTPVDFGRVAHRAARERPGIVAPADATALPGFEENLPLRELTFRPRRPKFVLPLFAEAPARLSTP